MNEKEIKFVQLFTNPDTGGNASQAAIGAGYSENRARQTGWELTHKNSEVMAAISKTTSAQKINLSDGASTPDAIFEANISKAIETLAANTGDPAGAKAFFESYLKHKTRKQELLGEYAELSSAELIRKCDDSIEELKTVKNRLLAEIGSQEVQGGSDLPSE